MVSNENNNINTSNTFGFGIPTTVSAGSYGNANVTYNMAGGSSVSAGADGDDDDDNNSSVVDDAEDDSDDEEDDYTPPSREEYENLLAEKRRADSESAARKRLLRQAGLDPKTGKPVKQKVVLETLDDDDDDDDTSEEDAKAARDAAKGVSRAKQEKSFQRQLEREVAKTERRVRDQSTVLIAAIPTALSEEGWNGKNLSRILKLIDMDNVTVDEDGEVDGLVDEIDELKKDFPEFFKRQRMKDAAKDIPDTKTVGGGTKTAASSEKDLPWTEQLKKNLYGK